MTAKTKIDWKELAFHAEAMRDRAYAPYSDYRVGAALLCRGPKGTQTFGGANVENASFGLCVCAERTAIAAAVLAGAKDLLAIAVATRGPEPGSPCGMCRQVMAEFADDLPVGLVVDGVVRKRTSLKKLLPDAFRAERLKPARRTR